MLRISKEIICCQALLLCLFATGNVSALYKDPSPADDRAFHFNKEFEDEEGCLLCHKYPKLARVTELGARRSYYVIPEVYGDTVHRHVECGDCHNYIKQLPHKEVKTGVTCDSECHSVENPATGKPFNHKAIVKQYEKSVHFREKVASGNAQDKPYCITCHRNPVYNPKEILPPKRILDRCIICHEDRKFVAAWYKHTSRRIKEVRREASEIIGLCRSCHGDERLVKRHLKAAAEEGRELGPKYAHAVESYDNSFHGKITRYGFQPSANCLDCHAEAEKYFLKVHNIRPSRDPKATTSPERRAETCRRCHTDADDNYASLDPHPTYYVREDVPFLYYAEHMYGWIGNIVIATFVGLALFETIGRRRDGVGWMIRRGSSWWRRSSRGRDRVG